MELSQVGSVVAITGGVVALVFSAERKSRFFSATMACLILLQLPRLFAYDPGGWFSLSLGVLSLVFVVLHVRTVMRDPEWRASWRK